MAERLNKRHAEQTRKAIKATQIVNRLQRCVFGEVELTSQQIKAAEILLKKALPDLAQVELDARVEGEVSLIQLLTREAGSNDDSDSS